MQVGQGMDGEVVSHPFEGMRRKKETNLNSVTCWLLVQRRVSAVGLLQADNRESRKEKKLRLSRGERSQSGRENKS